MSESSPYPEAECEIEVFPLPEGIIAEKGVPLEMWDGIKLAANVYRPDKPGRFPVIMSFTPYGKDVSPHEYLIRWKSSVQTGISMGKYRVSEAASFEAPDPAFWVPNDYTVIHVDTRGSGKSAGERGVFTLSQRRDYYDAIEWAGTQGWSNGNVGLSGVSYLATSQWFAASTQPPHLKAITPWEGFSSGYRDLSFPGGVPETAFSIGWAQRTLGRQRDEAALARAQDPVLNQRWLKTEPQLENITVPTLICATWSDQGLHSRGGFEGFRRISSQDKWLYTHGRKKWEEYYSDEGLRYQKKFFDYFLKGVDNRMMDTPRVRLEVRETLDDYTVRYENEWPIARTQYKKLYLDSEAGTLNFDEVSHRGKVSYDSADGRAVFDITFDQDTELSGHMKLKLWVSAGETDDMDLFIGVKKLDVDGNEVHFYGMSGYVRGIVARGWLRLSQRELDEERSTPWQPILKHQGEQKLEPGEIVPAEIEILPSSTLFRKGETLTLVIQGKDMVEHPMLRYTRLVNKGAHSIYSSRKHDSHLLIPVIPARSQ